MDAKQLNSLEPIKAEIRTYLRELPRLLAEGHEGRHALIHGDAVLSIWDTFDDAHQAGAEKFGLGRPYITQPIERQFLEYAWPEEFLAPKGQLNSHGQAVVGIEHDSNNSACSQPSGHEPAMNVDPAKPLEFIKLEIRTYLRELSRLLDEGHEGKFVLVKGDRVLSIWDTFDDACEAARERFPLGEAFLAQPIDARDLTRTFPEELRPRQAI